MKRFTYLILATMTAIGAAAMSAQAALNSYMWIKDASGADIRGSVTIPGREGSVEVVALDQNVFIPIDPNTGLPTGTRRHDPFAFVKNTDASTPYLYHAICQGQMFSRVTVKTYRVDNTGAEREYFTCVLDNVRLVKVAPALDNVFSSKKKCAPLEQVAFLYARATWTFVDGNITYTDNIIGPVAR